MFSFDSGVSSWQSNKQDSDAQSSIEVQYVAAALAISETIW